MTTMKCDELEEEYLWTNNVKTPSTIMVRAYNADDVDSHGSGGANQLPGPFPVRVKEAK